MDLVTPISVARGLVTFVGHRRDPTSQSVIGIASTDDSEPRLTLTGGAPHGRMNGQSKRLQRQLGSAGSPCLTADRRSKPDENAYSIVWGHQMR
jgi:hypothetical protein